ncbi:MAG: zinc-dependent alcohol dehydrogenase family protein [Deltaproteobacteria bacterium]|nr:zinc-dependent alcohol dehydrogenase family protein [Deltaproteobacteria bacterium]
MRALFLKRICDLRTERRPLTPGYAPDPVAADGEIILKVGACGVCHTELDEIEGRTPPSFFPIIPGHQVVGRVVERGAGVSRLQIGDRVGVGWIFSTCGICPWCRSDRENLCEQFRAAGRDAHGGYAEFMKVREAFAIPIPAEFSDSEAAPLLCAGAIGYRSLRLAGIQDGQALGLTGFGASAHLVLKMVRHQYPKSDIFVFARSEQERLFARELGAVWAGDTEETPPELLDAIIDTTPAWRPIVAALKNLKSGGRLVINAIRKEDADKDSLLGLDYPHYLWLEKEIKSVANVTRRDIRECLDLAARIPIKPEYREYVLEDANQALLELKERKIRGAKVLRI